MIGVHISKNSKLVDTNPKKYVNCLVSAQWNLKITYPPCFLTDL